MNKYKVGDKVKVRSDLEMDKVYKSENGAEDSVVGEMLGYRGKTVLIERDNAGCEGDKYRIEGFSYNWTDDMFEGLAEDKPTRIPAYKLMALAAENPQEYEGRKYKVIDGLAVSVYGKGINEFIIRQGVFDGCGGHLYISITTELEEIPPEPKPVPVLEAIEAFEKGKVIACTESGFTHKYKNGSWDGMKDETGEPVTAREILRGTWTIIS